MKWRTTFKRPKSPFPGILLALIPMAGICLFRLSRSDPDPGSGFESLTGSTSTVPAQASMPLLPILALAILGGALTVWYRRSRSARRGTAPLPEMAEEMRRTLFEETSDTIIIHDDQFRIVETNSAAERLLGYTGNELRQMRIQDLFDPDYIKRKPLLIDQILSGAHVFSERTMIRKDRQAVIIGVKVRRIGPDRLLAIIEDLTEGHSNRHEPNETLLRNSIDSSATGICIVGLDGRFLNVNAALGAITGYSGPELTKLRFQEITHPDDIDRDLDFIEKARAGTENVYRTEKRYYRKDGSIIWVRVNVATIRDETGEPLHFFAQIEDVTESREANNNYRLLMEQSLVGVYIFQDSRFAYVSPRMAAIFGYTQQELLDLPSGDLIIHEDDRDIVRAQVLLRESGQKPVVHYEIRGRRKTGDVIWTEVIGATTVYKGRPAFIGTLQDITERKTSETAILHEKELLETVIKSLPGIFYISEPDGRLLRWNDHLEKVLGYTADELQGKYTTDLAEGDQAGRIRNASALALKTGKVTGEVRIMSKTGQPFTYYVSVMPIIYNGRQRMLGIGLDFSEKKKTEAALASQTAEVEARGSELQAFFESVEGAAALLDSQQRFRILNKKFLDDYKRMTGQEPVAGREAFDHLPPDKKATHQRLLDRVMEGHKEILEATYELDGTRFFYRTSFSPVFSSSGAVTGISVYSIDLTSFQESEMQLRKINNALNERVKELRCMYRVSEVVNDDEYTVEGMVRQLVTIIPFGWQYPDITCVKLVYGGKQFCSGDYCESEWSQEAAVISNDSVVGKIIVSYLEETPAADEGPFLREERALINTIAEMLGSAIGRKHSREKLSESEEQFRKLTEETPVGVYILQDQKFCYVNPQFEEITGYRKEELLQDFPFDKLIHEEDLESARKAYTARIEGRATDGQSTFRGVRADNTIRYIDLITSHIRYQGKPAVIGTVTDITEKVEEEKRFNLAITEAQESERLAIGMELHDNVKQIIATSLLSLYKVRANLDEKDAATRYLNEAQEQIREAVAELRKISHQLAPSVDTSIPIEEKVAALIARMNVSEQTQVVFDVNLQNAAMSSAVQLAFYRIIQEQFSNILKYANATQVTIAMTATDDLLELSMTDNGIGFDPAVQKLGIGLENIRRRAKALDGTVSILSTPGGGCSLRVQVPPAP